jgi:hypothetical protein
MSGISRRTFLGLAAMGPGLAMLRLPVRADEGQLSSFLALSREATGFRELDAGLAQRYLAGLLDWQPRLAGLLARQGQRPGLVGLTRDEQALVEQVIEVWYTGTLPTARGTEVVTYEGALGWACLPRRTPVTFCRE